MPSSLPMSPAQAAQVLKVSRRTIMRAIDSRELTALRDNKNHWKIREDDLMAWASAQCSPSEQMPIKPTSVPTNNLPDDSIVELATLRTENRFLLERIASLEEEKNEWKDLANKLAAKPSFLSWLWKR